MNAEIDYARAMYRFVAPTGTAIWAMQQLAVNQPGKWVGGTLLLITALSVFSAFNYSIELLDRELNHETQGVPTIAEATAYNADQSDENGGNK